MTALEPTPSGSIPLTVRSDPGFTFRAQIPTVYVHTTVMSSLDLAEFSLVGIEHIASGHMISAWLLSDESDDWARSPYPWASTVRLSDDCWVPLTGGTDEVPTRPQALRLTLPHHRVAVRPALVSSLLAGDEIGMHADDAAHFGVGAWAFVNWGGVPTALRVRTTRRDRDRGFARLSFQTRLLLGMPGMPDRSAEIVIAPLPVDAAGKELRVPEPMWTPVGGALRAAVRRLRARISTVTETVLQAALRSPSITCRTLEATPGDDTLGTVRLAPEAFALLGTEPGKEVYLSWGPGNRTAATALPIDGTGAEFTPPHIVGRRLDHLPEPPAFARVQVGAASRAALGIPRTTLLTVRRRVLPLITVRVNELIVPVTALFIAFSADLGLTAWQLVLIAAVVLALLIAPLRVRRPPRGRVPV